MRPHREDNDSVANGIHKSWSRCHAQIHPVWMMLVCAQHILWRSSLTHQMMAKDDSPTARVVVEHVFSVRDTIPTILHHVFM